MERDKNKGEDGVKAENNIWMLHNIIGFMLPVSKSKNYSRFHEFRQVICPLNKHKQNKQNVGKIFKIQVFEDYINNNGIFCNCYAKTNKGS